jgi:IS30 family transposase
VTLAARLTGKTAAETISVMLAVFERINSALRKSITFDNDTAFAQHALLRATSDMATWFCDAYASWQKGGVENAKGRLRRWLPRHIDIDRLSDGGIQGHRHDCQSDAAKMSGLPNPAPSHSQRDWQRRSNPLLMNSLRFAPESTGHLIEFR